MKKFFTILSTLALFVTGFMFTGCDEEVVEVLAGPTNTWCKMPVTYKNSDDSNTSANLYAYFYYTDYDTTVSNKSLAAGLHIVVTAADDNASSLISGLTSSVYLIKSFPKDQDTTVSDSDSDTDVITVNGARAKWSAIYWAKDELNEAENKSKNPPSAFANGSDLAQGVTLENFSWKRLLANYLLSILEE